jgi:tRNA-intron endonuclease
MIAVSKSGNAYFVYDEKDCITLYWNRYFGKPVNLAKPKPGDRLSPLRLSRTEVLYLSEKGEVTVEGAKRRIVPPPRPSLVYNIYKDLRDSGFIVRSGLKFGATFAVYAKGPGIDHAPFLVQVISPKHRVTGVEVIRAGRLSHGIRKSFVFATEKRGGPVYITLRWVKS